MQSVVQGGYSFQELEWQTKEKSTAYMCQSSEQ